MKNKGFTLVEMLFSMIIFSLSMSLVLFTLPLLKQMQDDQVHLEKEIAFRQLRRVIALSESIIVQSDNLNFFYLGNNATLEINQDQLVKRNGYVLYYEGFDYAQFKQKDHCIYFQYEQDGKNYEEFLGCKT